VVSDPGREFAFTMAMPGGKPVRVTLERIRAVAESGG
jgi:hypothetical protein